MMATGKAMLALVSIASLLHEGVEITKRIAHELEPVLNRSFSFVDVGLVVLSLIGLWLAGSEIVHHAKRLREHGVRQASMQLAIWLLLLTAAYYGILFAVQVAPTGLLIWFGLYLSFVIAVAFGSSGDRPFENRDDASPDVSSGADGSSKRSRVPLSGRFRIYDV